MTKEYFVLEVVTTNHAYYVNAESPEDAVSKLENQCFAESKDITRAPEYDKTTDRYALCDD